MSYLLGGGMLQVRMLASGWDLAEAVFKIILLPENSIQAPKWLKKIDFFPPRTFIKTASLSHAKNMIAEEFTVA